MPSLKVPDVRVVLGRGGSGKTHLVRHWLDRIKGRVLVFDPNKEPAYQGFGMHVFDRADVLISKLLDGGERFVWDGIAPGDFEMFNRIAFAAGDVTIVWEEVDQFQDAGRLPPCAFKIVNQGRHRGIRVMACARRPARVSRDMTANAKRIVAFRSIEPRDVAYLRDYIGEPAASLPRLGQYQAIDWTERAGAKVRKSPFP